MHKCPEIKTSVVHPIWADTPLIAVGKEELKKNGQTIIDPQTVSDAVVKQVLQCKSGQIILAGSGIAATIISSLRGYPTWIQELLRRTMEAAPAELQGMNVKDD